MCYIMKAAVGQLQIKLKVDKRHIYHVTKLSKNMKL
jgi:hypothetical protein